MHAETLIYDFDPLCGWCFAFGPSFRAAAAANPDLPVALRYGGLVVGARVGPIAEHRGYLLAGFERVRQVAGFGPEAPFLEGLLAEGTYVSDSEPPCRAIFVMEQIAPAGAFGFAAALPDLHYREGVPLDDVAALAELAAANGADPALFAARWRSPEARAGVQAAFARHRASGAVSYPTLRYRRGDQDALVAQGFATPDETVRRIGSLRSLG
ncbi:MAG TPA: hypothetical protein PKD53_07785 [Chloroflexaceae bacterium]|nr:hypothetical protein [Chloroflexaceae bacterium]